MLQLEKIYKEVSILEYNIAYYKDTDSGMIFVRESKEADGPIFIGKKLDVKSLPPQMYEDDKMLIPKGTNRSDYCDSAKHYGGFNYKVLKGIKNTTHQFGYFFRESIVDVISPDSLERVAEILLDKYQD